jgi:peptidoglycan hydrolase-like protein with peptidoglycan-binding domain
MTLQEIASGAPAVQWQWLDQEKTLCRELQARLLEIGLLDGPPDGQFGPVSFWALTQWLKRAELAGAGRLDAGVARALLSPQAAETFTLRPDDTLAGRIVVAMRQQRLSICRHPDALNIIYVEGMNLDGTRNDDAPNVFNDLRLAVRVRNDGVPVIEEAWVATTEPGTYYTRTQKLDPRGAARIALGQFKAWSVGVHMAGRPSAHEALVQSAPIDIHRDLNEDFERAGDHLYTGVFGINQHYGFDAPVDDIGRASAGCLVGRAKAGHRSFMSMCRADPRYQANHSYRFVTTVLSAEAVT